MAVIGRSCCGGDLADIKAVNCDNIVDMTSSAASRIAPVRPDTSGGACLSDSGARALLPAEYDIASIFLSVENVHALEGLACRKRVAPASSKFAAAPGLLAHALVTNQ